MWVRLRTRRRRFGVRGTVTVVALLALTVGLPAAAGPMVTFTTTDLGGGWFEYDLCLGNPGGSEPLSGLNLPGANTVFGLTGSSVIGAPTGWSFFAPLPPWVDELNYFSLANSSDVAVNASLGGFSFQSMTDPASIGFSFAVEAIGGTTSIQIPLNDAVLAPEPKTALLLAVGLAVSLLSGRGRETRRSRRGIV